MANVEVAAFSTGCWSISRTAQGDAVDREGPASGVRLRVRDPDGADEPPPRRRWRRCSCPRTRTWSFLSSSLVKEVARFGGDVEGLVPDQVAEAAASTGWRSAELMDITARLSQLDEMVREAKAMPLSSSVLVNRDEVLDLLAEMQEALPDEIKQARWIVKDREELLAKARADGGARSSEQAREEQLRMARKEDIVAPRAGGGRPHRSPRPRSRRERCGARPRSTSTPSSRSSRSRLRRILEDSQAAVARAREDARSGRGRARQAARARPPPPSRSSATRRCPTDAAPRDPAVRRGGA